MWDKATKIQLLMATGRKPKSPGVLYSQYKIPEAFEKRFIEEFFAQIDSPIALSCYMLWKYDEHEQLARKTIDPHQYNDALVFERDFRAVSFLQKDPGLNTGIDKEAAALLSFMEGEAKCAETNREFYAFINYNKVPKGLSVDRNLAKFERMRQIVAKVLGKFNVTELFESGTWGPGSTLAITGTAVDQAIKYSCDTSVTQEAYHLFWAALESYAPNWLVGRSPLAPREPRFEAGNKVVTVPKNAKTDRTIAIEPGLNSWLQLGCGKMIRRRILRVLGLNLNTDQRNQDLARRGSLDGTIATLDFKNASNTISYRLIEALLPEDWWIVLRALRSPAYTLPDGTTHKCEMFSSMGCGFTWELESLIFVAAAIAVSEAHGGSRGHISVFGDDITLSSGCAAAYVSFVEALGFSINQQKSYDVGYFRESCGSYFFGGCNTKPIYKKGKYDTPRSLFKLANAITRLAATRGGNLTRDAAFLGLWKLVVHAIPKPFRAFGPAEYGDSVIQVCSGDKEAISSALRPQGGWQGYVFPSFGEQSLSGGTEDYGLLLARTRRMVSEVEDLRGRDLRRIALSFLDRDEPVIDGGNTFSLRRRTKTVFKKRSFSRQWYFFGPWS